MGLSNSICFFFLSCCLILKFKKHSARKLVLVLMAQATSDAGFLNSIKGVNMKGFQREAANSLKEKQMRVNVYFLHFELIALYGSQQSWSSQWLYK